MADPSDEAKDSMESLSWPDTSRPIVSYGSNDDLTLETARRDMHVGMPRRRRWPALIAILILLAVIAVVAVTWIF
jgi:hypothetical protein